MVFQRRHIASPSPSPSVDSWGRPEIWIDRTTSAFRSAGMFLILAFYVVLTLVPWHARWPTVCWAHCSQVILIISFILIFHKHVFPILEDFTDEQHNHYQPYQLFLMWLANAMACILWCMIFKIGTLQYVIHSDFWIRATVQHRALCRALCRATSAPSIVRRGLVLLTRATVPVVFGTPYNNSY